MIFSPHHRSVWLMQSDWDASSDEEEEKRSHPIQQAPPPKKKSTLKAKLIEKEAAKATRSAQETDDDVAYDSDQVLDPREKARLDKQREVNSDLNNTADLFGAAALGGTTPQSQNRLSSAHSPVVHQERHHLN